MQKLFILTKPIIHHCQIGATWTPGCILNSTVQLITDISLVSYQPQLQFLLLTCACSSHKHAYIHADKYPLSLIGLPFMVTIIEQSWIMCKSLTGRSQTEVVDPSMTKRGAFCAVPQRQAPGCVRTNNRSRTLTVAVTHPGTNTQLFLSFK